MKDGRFPGGCIPDVADIDLRAQNLVPHPQHPEAFRRLQAQTPARLCCWRAGPRPLTSTVLRFRADHSAAQDSVFSFVSESFLKACGLFTVDTLCRTKEEYVTRPDLGRSICPEGVELIRRNCVGNPDVQIVAGDGLSAAAIEANLTDVLPAITAGLTADGITVGTPFFIRFSRVAAMDVVSELTGAKVTCILIGERPGLVTAKSMSAYIAYRATVGMLETRRSVVSNIHRGGTMPVEAGAYIAELIKTMLRKKASGTEL